MFSFSVYSFVYNKIHSNSKKKPIRNLESQYITLYNIYDSAKFIYLVVPDRRKRALAVGVIKEKHIFLVLANEYPGGRLEFDLCFCLLNFAGGMPIADGNRRSDCRLPAAAMGITGKTPCVPVGMQFRCHKIKKKCYNIF